jgi:filamentous hemagglutinin
LGAQAVPYRHSGGAGRPDAGDQPEVPHRSPGQQGKHIPGHNNFTPGRSELTHANPSALLDQHAVTGTPLRGTPGQPGFRERIDFGEPIGFYVDPASGARAPTNIGVVHYSNSGAHIVPARP